MSTFDIRLALADDVHAREVALTDRARLEIITRAMNPAATRYVVSRRHSPTAWTYATAQAAIAAFEALDNGAQEPPVGVDNLRPVDEEGIDDVDIALDVEGAARAAHDALTRLHVIPLALDQQVADTLADARSFAKAIQRQAREVIVADRERRREAGRNCGGMEAAADPES